MESGSPREQGEIDSSEEEIGEPEVEAHSPREGTRHEVHLDLSCMQDASRSPEHDTPGHLDVVNKDTTKAGDRDFAGTVLFGSISTTSTSTADRERIIADAFPGPAPRMLRASSTSGHSPFPTAFRSLSIDGSFGRNRKPLAKNLENK